MKSDLAGGQLPSGLFGANAAWWALAILAFNLNAAMKRLALGESWAAKRMKALRFHLIGLPGRVISHARRWIICLGGGTQALATIVFGAALLIQGAAMLSEYAGIIFPEGATSATMDQFGGSSLSALFLAGAAGIVLGILALLGVHSDILTSIAIIAFGAGLLLSANSVRHLHVLKRMTESQTTLSGAAVVANEMAAGSVGVQSLAGLAGIVLGILALAGAYSVVLDLAALIVLGATLVMTGSSLSATVVSFMRPGTPNRATTRSA